MAKTRRHDCWRSAAASRRCTGQLVLLGLVILGIVLAGVGLRASPAATEGAPPAEAVASEGPSSAAPRCSLHQDETGWWFVSPAGERFFSLGICQFDQGSSREEYDPENPSYAAWRHYETPAAWASASVLRLKDWGFTTIGGWSDFDTLRRSPEQSLWLAPVLHSGSTAGLPWWDMWDERHLRRMEDVASKTILPLRHDPHVLGYYSDNEIGWWNAALWKMTLEHEPTSSQRRRLVQLLRDVYASDWDALLEDFEPEGAANWQELDQGGMLWVKPGADGIRTTRRFLRLVADRYYELMRDVIKKHDPDALFLGDRYQSFYYPEVVQASAAYVDAVSTNLSASWNDGRFLRSYLYLLHKWTERPVAIGEFYMAAHENRSGNPNSQGEFPTVDTQAQRAEALATTLRALVALPYVVGADWFQYYDEPPLGRYDGEDFNFGLVDIHDQPYEEVTAAFSALDLRRLKLQGGGRREDASDGVPPAPIDPYKDLTYMQAIKSWDRERGYVPPGAQQQAGDLYVCWNESALYLGVYVIDVVEPDYYRDGEVPEIDRALWTVQIADRPPVTARVGAGKMPVVNDPSVRVEPRSGVRHDARCMAVMELPTQWFGKERLKPGDQITFQSSFVTHGRAYRLEWNGTFTLGDETSDTWHDRH